MAENKDVIAIYTRKSKFTGKGESIENQAELCREYIRQKFGEKYVESAQVYEDEGFSGKNMNRPEFQKMLKSVRAHQYKMIIVYRLDRISRSIGDFAGLIQELDKLDVEFVSVRDKFETDSAMGRAMMYIASIFSQMEREVIAERIRDNMHELAKTGRWLGGMTPTGYHSKPIVVGHTADGKERKAFQLEIDNEEAKLIKLIFSRFLEYRSLTKLETELLQQHVVTKKGREFKRHTIKSILQNPAYLIADEAAYRYFKERNADICFEKEAFDGKHGIAAYNRTKQETGKATTNLPVSEWIIAVGKHEGLIMSEDWIQTQLILAGNKSKGYRKPSENRALLTGVIYCKCGARMYHKPSDTVNEHGERIFSYMCSRKDQSRKALCNTPNPNGNILDEAIVARLKEMGEDKSEYIRQLEKCRKMFVESNIGYTKSLNDLKKRVADNEKKMRGLVDSLADADSRVTRRRVLERMEELEQVIDDDKRSIVELEGFSDKNALSDIEFDYLRRALATFSSMADEMDIDQKRRMIKTLVRKVVWDGETVHVYFFGAEGDAELPNLDETEGNGDLPGKQRPPIDEKFQWGEDSK